MVVDRLELRYTRQHLRLAELVKADIWAISPETTVNLVPLVLDDPWDFGEVYDWSRDYAFDPARERYWAHITTGTHVTQICLFLPGVLLQTAPPKRQRATRNARFNTLIDEIERVAVRSKAPVLLTGPTGAGKSHLAQRWRCSATRRARSPGRPRRRLACCGRRTRVCCSSTRSANSARTSRRCCSRRWRKSGSIRWALSGSITRLATLADGGRIGTALAELDLFDRLQLEAVVAVCRKSRTQRSVVNDADRLRKYLGRYRLDWARVSGRSE